MRKILLSNIPLLLLGCNNGLLPNNSDTFDEFTNRKPLEEITNESIEKLLMMDGLFTTRNANSDDDYPELLNDIIIEDEEGNSLSFNNFSDEEKNYFYEEWKKNLYEDIFRKLSNDDGLAEMYDIENEAFFETEKSIQGSRYIKTFDVEKFISLYEKNLQKRVKKNNERAAAKKCEIDRNCLVNASVEKLKSNYQQGNFLVCKDSSSSSSSSGSYVGHASLMNRVEWDDTWEEDGLGKITITSSPVNKSAQWDKKVDGVQYEPIGYWAGYAEGTADKVSIYQVEHHKAVWKNLFKIEHVKTPVSDNERKKACEIADSYKGCGYSWLYINKWREDKIYCSQLVWKSWYNTSSDCDLSLGKLIVFVSPSDLTKSQSAKFLVSYSNNELYNEEHK